MMVHRNRVAPSSQPCRSRVALSDDADSRLGREPDAGSAIAEAALNEPGRAPREKMITASIVIQRFHRGQSARRRVLGLKAVAEEVTVKTRITTHRRRKSLSRSMTASGSLAAGVVPSVIAPLRILKSCTLAFKAPAALKSVGRWRYELTLDKLRAEDVGNVLVGFALDHTGDSAWQSSGFATGESPRFEAPTRWWGAVLSRAQLDAEAAGDVSVVVSVAVDLEEAYVWYNLFRDVSQPQDSSMRLQSVYRSGQAPGGWQRVSMPDLRPTDAPSDEARAEARSVYPAFSLVSSENVVLNFGDQPFASTPPELGGAPFLGLLRAGEPSPVRRRELTTVGGQKLAVDYNEKMPMVVQLVAMRGSWELMCLMLSGSFASLKGKLTAELAKCTDAESLALVYDDGGEKVQPHHFCLPHASLYFMFSDAPPPVSLSLSRISALL